MTVSKNSAFTGGAGGSPTTVLNSELNSLADNGTSAASAVWDNTTAKSKYGAFKFVVAAQGGARKTGGFVEIMYVASIDNGSTYPDLVRGVAGWLTIPLDAASTARQRVTDPIELLPAKYKFAVYQDTDQAFAASGSTVAIETWNDETT